MASGVSLRSIFSMTLWVVASTRKMKPVFTPVDLKSSRSPTELATDSDSSCVALLLRSSFTSLKSGRAVVAKASLIFDST